MFKREYKGNSLIDIPDKYIVFDIETTGLDTKYNEIIEIGAIKYENEKRIEVFNTFIKPRYEIDEFITSLTGITNEMVKNAPSIESVLPEFMKFVEGYIIVGHNVNFDINFIYDNLEKLNMPPITNNFVDTLRLGRRLIPELKHHTLSDLARYFKIDTAGNHRSIKDVEITAEVLNELKKIVEKEYQNVENFRQEYAKNRRKKFKASDIKAGNIEFDETNILFDKYVVITGTLEKIQRKEAMQIIANLGGHCQDAVNKDTNYLILGNTEYNTVLKGKKSAKLVKAQELKLKGKDIDIISENVFYDLIPEIINKKNEEIKKQNSLDGKSIDEGNFNEKERLIFDITKKVLEHNEKNISDVRCNINSSNYFDIGMFGLILRTKLRGKKDYIIIDEEEYKSYDFSCFEYDKSTDGKYRLIMNNIADIEKLEQYIVNKYESVLEGNKDYIENVRIGRINYNRYLKENYQ